MKLMKGVRFLLSVLCMSVVFCGCISAEGSGSSSLYLKKNAFGNSVYYACSPSRRTDQQELSECLFRVARQIALRTKVIARLTVTTGKDQSGKVVSKSEVSLDFDQLDSISMSDSMVVLKAQKVENGTEVLVRFDGNPSFRNISITTSDRLDRAGNPGWVTKPPKGGAFYAAVGFSPDSSGRADSILAADSSAIGSLAACVANPSVNGSTKVYEATLRGAYIARRWHNEREGRYYSLAILPR
jgi:hypothetical protein